MRNHVRAKIIFFIMLLKNAVRSMAGFIQAFSLLCLSVFSLGQSGSASPATSSDSSTSSPVIVIGFMGGFVKHDNAVHSGVQLATHLRQDYASGVYVQVFENRRREKAHQEILRLLSKNHDGTLTAEEKQNARVIIYGMSWGASETVTLARELERTRSFPPTSLRPPISISRADCSTASLKSGPPMVLAHGFSAIIALTTSQNPSGATRIPGTIASLRRATLKSNVIRPFGIRSNPSFARRCLRKNLPDCHNDPFSREGRIGCSDLWLWKSPSQR